MKVDTSIDDHQSSNYTSTCEMSRMVDVSGYLIFNIEGVQSADLLYDIQSQWPILC